VPNFEPPILVATLAALKDIHVAELDEGTQAWVSAENTIYILKKALGLAETLPFIVVPRPGSPIAGAAGAGWERLPPGGGLLATLFARLTADTTATSAAPAVATVPFTVTGAGQRVVATASFSGEADRFGDALFEILIDGADVPPDGVGETVLANVPPQAVTVDILGALTTRSNVLTVGPHTLSVRLTPGGALVVQINAGSEQTTDHMHVTGLLVSV
jgi:hypothetical protein